MNVSESLRQPEMRSIPQGRLRACMQLLQRNVNAKRVAALKRSPRGVFDDAHIDIGYPVRMLLHDLEDGALLVADVFG